MIDMPTEKNFPEGCDTSEMPEFMKFRIKSLSSNVPAPKDRYSNKSEIWVDRKTGKGTAYFENLPTGGYLLEAMEIGILASHQGTLDFTIKGFGAIKKPYFYPWTS